MQKRVEEILIKIRDGHRLWTGGDSGYKNRLEKAFNPYLDELEELGVDRYFAQALLFFGRDFVDSLKVDNNQNNIVQDSELIFGVKAENLTEREQKELNLALKNNAFDYQPIPTGNDKVKIKVLNYTPIANEKQQKLI